MVAINSNKLFASNIPDNDTNIEAGLSIRRCLPGYYEPSEFLSDLQDLDHTTDKNRP